MELSEQSYSALAAAFREAVSGYAGGDENSAVTDIHVQPNSDSGELLVFNDDEEELARAIILRRCAAFAEKCSESFDRRRSV